MAHPLIRPGWHLPEGAATPEGVFRQRRRFLRRMAGLTGVTGLIGGAGAVLAGCEQHAVEPIVRAAPPVPEGPLATIAPDAPRAGLPAPRNPAFTVPERPLTDRVTAASYNNFYEFTSVATDVWRRTGWYDPFPWTVEVDGLVERPTRFDVDALIRTAALEERVYRHRCVEAWAMTVPWTGFPLAWLIDRCRPLSGARFVRFVSVHRPSELPGQQETSYYPWPYYEALRMDEARHALAFVATGVYGAPLPKQHGAPLRIVLPWKYGFKGPKAVVRIEFTAERPGTFWSDLVPGEYGFTANVNPYVPHPRWSQAMERLLGEDEPVPTRPFNGYGDWVGALYPDEPRG